jgi:glycosyltransferase involved in cell wall biosynthesis
MTKQIFLEFVGKKHSLYDSLVKYPPNDYKIISPPANITSKHHFNRMYSFISKNIPIIPMKLIRSYTISKQNKNKEYYLIYCAGHINFSKNNWVTDFEYATHLAGYNEFQFRMYKWIIEKRLESNNCKYLLPWTNICKKTIESCFKNKIIQKKIRVINLAIPNHDIKKIMNNETITFLFISSKNFPLDFYNKGGLLVLETFRQLQKKYNNINLIIRSKIPPSILFKYRDLKNIQIIDEILSNENLSKLFQKTDIFIYPSHTTPALAFLDAMSYGIPIITTNVWANTEMVINDYNGLIVDSPLSKFIDNRYIPLWGSNEFIRQSQSINEELINQLVKASEILINDDILRNRLGKNGKNEIENGKFSIQNRNAQLIQLLNKM